MSNHESEALLARQLWFKNTIWESTKIPKEKRTPWKWLLQGGKQEMSKMSWAHIVADSK